MPTWKYSTRNNKTAAYLLPEKQYTNIFYGTAPPAPRYPAVNLDAIYLYITATATGGVRDGYVVTA